MHQILQCTYSYNAHKYFDSYIWVMYLAFNILPKRRCHSHQTGHQLWLSLFYCSLWYKDIHICSECEYFLAMVRREQIRLRCNPSRQCHPNKSICSSAHNSDGADKSSPPGNPTTGRRAGSGVSPSSRLTDCSWPHHSIPNLQTSHCIIHASKPSWMVYIANKMLPFVVFEIETS